LTLIDANVFERLHELASISVQSAVKSPMTYKGKVQNGVIHVADGIRLPEGADVQIELVDEDDAIAKNKGEPTIWQKLAELGRWAETIPTDLPEDLAANHDHYLHGTPKRQ
jgi:hypothetical protein